MKFYCHKCNCDLCESARAEWEAYTKMTEERIKANQMSASQNLREQIMSGDPEAWGSLWWGKRGAR
jgi:hypothetical protein